MSPYDRFVGARVIVRAHMAGVYVGTVIEAAPDGVVLGTGARQLHYWARGGSTHQIAERGIGGDCRVTAPSSSPRALVGGAQVVDVIQVTDLAWDRIMAYPEWTGAL